MESIEKKTSKKSKKTKLFREEDIRDADFEFKSHKCKLVINNKKYNINMATTIAMAYELRYLNNLSMSKYEL